MNQFRRTFFPYVALALLTSFSLTACSSAVAQTETKRAPQARGGAFTYPPKLDGVQVEVYKTIGDVKLNLYVFNPAGHQATDQRAAIVFFFGGGWTSGSPVQFEQQCRYLASRGMVAMAADYRVASRHKVAAVDCVRDGKSAIRWIRENAAKLGVDPQRIAASGGSAGGHVAACTGVLTAFDEASENSQISSRPNALVLFNPAMAFGDFPGAKPLDKEKAKSLVARMGVNPEELSPAHHVREKLPPTLQFFGTADDLLVGAEVFEKRMIAAGNRCEMAKYDGQGHGFFNFGRGDNKYFRETLTATDRFLTSLGYLTGEPTVEKFVAELAERK